MSRSVYTYTDLANIHKSKNFCELKKYPQITVSADLRKSLNGKSEHDKVKGLISDDINFKVTEFHTFSDAITEEWNTDASKFAEMVLLSEFMREKIENAATDKDKIWLTGCMRNLNSMLSAIILLEQTELKPEDFGVNNSRNIELFLEAWRYLIKKDLAIPLFHKKMNSMRIKDAWRIVFKKVFDIDSINNIDTIVFHGFYYITPHQEKVMRLLEDAGFNLIYLIPYDERFPYVYEIWDKTYTTERGFDDKRHWHIEKSSASDPYGSIFEGEDAKIKNHLSIREYASIMEFVDDIKHIKENGFSIYSADFKSTNQILKDYFPEAYGERKILSYPIGQFINTLNTMWDDENQTIIIDEDKLIECFSSGWLSIDGVSGKQYMQDLMYILPFFNGCKNIEEWTNRIELFKKIEELVITPFKTTLDPDIMVSRWQEAISSPLNNFSMFAVESKKLDVILRLITQLLNMAKELFGKNKVVTVQDHIRTLDYILKKHEHSQELYIEERELIKSIFEKLSADNNFDALCHPADIARALDLFICGKYEEGEIQSNRVGLVSPLYFVDAACVKNKSKVHVCMSDIDTLPGSNKDYIWPLTEKKMREVFANTQNSLVLNLIQIMESTIVCNRYFIYAALKNKEVTISWISSMNGKLLAPSPYIKLLMNSTGIKLTPAIRNAITFNRVSESPRVLNRIEEYDNTKTPLGIIKEARMDYALCPMKYVLGYVVEKYPTYQSDFQMNYALNAFISSIYNLMKESNIRIDDVYEAVIALFPNMRKVEKRQVYDYIAYEHSDKDFDFGNRTMCGDMYYTDERIRIHYPNRDVKSEALIRYAKLSTPDGRRGMNLNEVMEVPDACTFCQHVSYCKNAIYVGDQENYYD